MSYPQRVDLKFERLKLFTLNSEVGMYEYIRAKMILRLYLIRKKVRL
jgi:hypothetical protein